jgi:hypothetical protein
MTSLISQRPKTAQILTYLHTYVGTRGYGSTYPGTVGAMNI